VDQYRGAPIGVPADTPFKYQTRRDK